MIRRIVTHARGNAVAYVALFLALTAGAYAATKAPKNSVVTKSIKNGAVKTSKLADGAVTNPKLANGAVSEAKVQTFAFQAVTLTNGWTAVASSPTPSFGKDVQGFVHLRGRFRAGTLTQAAFTLPSGFRPNQTEFFGTGTIFGGNSTPCIVTVTTDGQVIPGVTPGDTGCNPAGSTTVSGITFRADGS